MRTVYSQYRDTYVDFEAARLQLRDLVNSPKLCDDDKRRRIVRQFYDLMTLVLVFPFNTARLSLAGIELMGDVFAEYRDLRSALIYYMHGVSAETTLGV